MLKIFITMGSLFLIGASLNASAQDDVSQLPTCPNGAKLTGGYAPSPWPTCSALFSSVYVKCIDQGKSDEECRAEMQRAADAKDHFSQCLWQTICANKSPGSNKVVTRSERMDAESICRQ